MRESYYKQLPALKDGTLPGLSQIDLTNMGLFAAQKDFWIVNRCITPRGHRGAGHMRELFKTMLKDADDEQVILGLSINAYGPMNYADLRKWYARKGFQPATGIHRQWVTYIRHPRPERKWDGKESKN